MKLEFLCDKRLDIVPQKQIPYIVELYTSLLSNSSIQQGCPPDMIVSDCFNVLTIRLQRSTLNYSAKKPKSAISREVRSDK